MTERCILFADIAGSTALYVKLGDAEARHAVERCLKRVRIAVEGFGGRALKTIGDGVLADFPDVDAAMTAACEMQQRVADLPAVAGHHLSIRVGFHFGPVIEEEKDIFGDAVNLAARITEYARGGQILASSETLSRLPALMRQGTRELQVVTLKGKPEPVAIGEVIWRDNGDMTMVADLAPPPAPRYELILRHGEAVTQMNPGDEPLIIGREKHSGLVIGDPMASRQHARIEWREDKFMLVDQSTNGTWVSSDEHPQIALRREAAPLRGKGRISFGHPYNDEAPHVVFLVLARNPN
jgi:hypothetical protein